MTEIPEHLLKRSRERRSAMGGESDAAPAAGAASPATPATTAAATPAPKAAAAPAPRAEAPRPVPAYIAAAQSRRKIPIWISPILALMPIWAFLFINTMTQQPKKVVGPLAAGASTFTARCSSCHGGDGSGGVGYPLYAGEARKSFPNLVDQLRFVYNGTAGYKGQAYTPADRTGGAHVAGVKGIMPFWGSKSTSGSGELSDAEILAVVCEERFGLSSAEDETTYATEFNTWCSVDSANWTAVQDGGFDAIKLDVSTKVSIPSPAAAAATTAAAG